MFQLRDTGEVTRPSYASKFNGAYLKALLTSKREKVMDVEHLADG